MIRRPNTLLLLLPLGALLCYCALVTTGCAKNRLFTHVDSIPEVPSQFHYFNAFGYDTSMSLAVDGLTRETVKKYAFSSYYPSSSAFNLNEAQPNSKLIAINDPLNTSLYPGSATIQFQPVTSYLVFPSYGQYDTLYAPEKTITQSLQYVPEDVNTPLDGTTRIRFFSMMAGGTGASITMSPNVGSGTQLTMQSAYLATQPTSAAVTYTGTQPGQKLFSMTFGSNNTQLKISYLATRLGNANYTFMAVGDPKNYLNGLEPLPQLFMVQDGNPRSLTALTVSSISYPGNAAYSAAVTVINGAYNIPGLVGYGSGTFITQYPYLNLSFNNYNAQLLRWALAGDPPSEDVGDVFDPSYPYPSKLIGSPGRVATLSLPSGIYSSTLTPKGTFAPIYTSFNYSFQQGSSYTVCLTPVDTSATHCGSLIMQNDNSPATGLFKLRIINLMGGAPQLDVHLGGPSGPVLASAVPFGQATQYLTLNATSAQQTLYVTEPGSTTPLFPQDPVSNGLHVINIPFTSGNSATVYLLGLLPGTPYSGSGGYFGPYSLYITDAYITPNNTYSSGRPVQIYY